MIYQFSGLKTASVKYIVEVNVLKSDYSENEQKKSMKKIYATGILFIISLTVFSQIKPDSLSNEIIIGRNFKTNSYIKAKEYVFGGNIDSWHIDDSTKILIMQLRDKVNNNDDPKDTGKLFSFDLQSNRVIWQKGINYRNSTVDQYDNVLVKTIDNQSSCLNNETGESLWKSKNTLYYVNPDLKIGIGYKQNNTNSLEGIDMVTGKSIWKRKISRDFGLNDISQLNDSVIIVIAKGIHLVNLKNGTGWDYYSKTGKKDYTGVVASNVVSLGLSMLLGTDQEVYTGHDLFTDMVSNVLVDSTSIYMADKSSIVRLDLFGFEIWKKKLPAGLAGKSTIFMNDSSLCMINYGYAYLNGELVNYGKPFIAAFNKNTGSQLYLQTVGYKKERLNGCNVQQDTVFLLSKNHIFKYSLKSGSELWEQNYKTDLQGELTQFAGTDMYIEADSTYINLYLSDKTKMYVYTNKNNLMILNNDLLPEKTISLNDLFYCYLETNGYRFLENGTTTVVIDKKGQEIAELNISSNVLLRGQRLFEVEANSLVELNIDQLINH